MIGLAQEVRGGGLQPLEPPSCRPAPCQHHQALGALIQPVDWAQPRLLHTRRCRRHCGLGWRGWVPSVGSGGRLVSVAPPVRIRWVRLSGCRRVGAVLHPVASAPTCDMALSQYVRLLVSPVCQTAIIPVRRMPGRAPPGRRLLLPCQGALHAGSWHRLQAHIAWWRVSCGMTVGRTLAWSGPAETVHRSSADPAPQLALVEQAWEYGTRLAAEVACCLQAVAAPKPGCPT
jgi:hypothetical protein